MKNTLILLLLAAFSGCVTAHPDQAPVLHPDALAALKLPTLNPQTVMLTINNKRAINMRANNSSAIEGVVKDAVSQSIARGGLSLSAQSKNILAMVITDCEDLDPNAECVKITFNLKTPSFEVGVSSKAQNEMVANGSSISGRGDISDAYQTGLNMVLESLPNQVKKAEAKAGETKTKAKS